MSKTSRRSFLHTVGQGALCGGVGALGLTALVSDAEAGKPRVVVVRGKDPEKMLRAALKVFGGLEALVAGKKVALKPNMSFKNPAAWGNNTSPEVAAALARLIQEAKATEVLAIDHTMGRAGQSIPACGVGPALQALGVRIISADKRSGYVKRPLPQGQVLKSVDIVRELTATQVLINVPVIKHHNATKVSGGLKNLMGLIWDRSYLHQAVDLHLAIADLGALFQPALTVIDATRVMTNNGPQGPGKVEQLETLVVSNDPVAADAVALGLTRWDNQQLTPADVAHVMAAGKLGLGQSNLAKIKIIKKRV